MVGFILTKQKDYNMSKSSHTQFTSEVRVKYNPLNDDVLKDLFERYHHDDVETFRQFCIDTIMKGTGKKEKKGLFCNDLRQAPSKDKMVVKVQNFIFAGLGLGV